MVLQRIRAPSSSSSSSSSPNAMSAIASSIFSPLLAAFLIAVIGSAAPVGAFQLLSGGPLARGPFRSQQQQQQQRQKDRHRETLQKTLGIPDGLMNTLLKQNDDFSKRIWIVDNSGSMGMEDGHELARSGKGGSDGATRWSELRETVLLHAQLSAALRQPTEFRLLNDPNPSGKNEHKRRLAFTSSSSPSTATILPTAFSVGRDTSTKDGYKRARSILGKAKPSGRTPLLQSLAAVRREIVTDVLPKLKADGTKVAIVIVTDGAQCDPDDPGKDGAGLHREFTDSLRDLMEGLPVTVVLRLCTDYGPIVDLYNQLDAELDGLDVLDDYHAEAAEVSQHNPWLNYALVLHRMREMGQSSQLFDLLDERTFTRQELAEFCQLLFGTPRERSETEPLPDPDQDWQGFLDRIQAWQKDENLQFNPRTKEMAPWVDVEFLSLLN